ncbi:hypothetical protein [Pseudomonas serbica]|uniref:hypothetical protein n=1 Tax=Pseudomonas serbica TaxID=2965074 RepID=UPI00237B6CAF|nr:hypothetical protein [Pseudomonas serbica]
MQETYYVSLEPTSNQWHVSPITHDFPDTHWVFRVSARSEQEAVLKGVDCHKALTLMPTPSEMKVLRAVSSQVGKLKRVASEILVVQLEDKWLLEAQTLAEKGFFDLAHYDELIIHTNSAGWKAIEQHVAKTVSRQPESLSFSYG